MIKNNYQNMPHKWIYLLFIHVDWLASSKVIGQQQSEKTLLGPIFSVTNFLIGKLFIIYLVCFMVIIFLPRSFRSNSTVFTWLSKNQYQSNYIANHKCKQATIFSQSWFIGIAESFTVFHKPMRSKSWSNLVFSLKQRWCDTNQNQHYKLLVLLVNFIW